MTADSTNTHKAQLRVSLLGIQHLAETTMSNDDYLLNVLTKQDLSVAELNALRALRDSIQGQLNVLEGSPRFYYGGSFGKKTMIRAKYDLDIVVYWPTAAPYTIKGIYDAVGGVLKKHWNVVNSKTVAWELPFQGDFHLDVVPGKALDPNYYEANLYRTDTGTTLKTSLKKHIDTVRGSGRVDAIRLMKLWRVRNGVPFKKSFPLELMTIEGCKGKNASALEQQLLSTFVYIRDNILRCNIKDPANSNNSLTDDLDAASRESIRRMAQAAIDAQLWSQVFKEAP